MLSCPLYKFTSQLSSLIHPYYRDDCDIHLVEKNVLHNIYLIEREIQDHDIHGHVLDLGLFVLHRGPQLLEVDTSVRPLPTILGYRIEFKMIINNRIFYY